MKRLIERDARELRRKAFRERDDESMEAIWEVIDQLRTQGIDIGQGGEKELLEREKIKDLYRKKLSTRETSVKSPD